MKREALKKVPSTKPQRITTLFAAVALLVGLAGCSAGSSAGSSSGEGLTVFAAASLKASFTGLAKAYEAAHPGTTVTLSFAGSADLASQISQGAPADVFASADTRNMDKLQQAGLLDNQPRIFATNTLAIAVPPGNAAGIRSFADLAKPGIRLVRCAPQVPCGAAATAVEQQTGTRLSPVSEENSVTDVLGKVVSGEADAGLVYVSDVKAAAGNVEGIPFPEADAAVNSYPIAVLANSRNSAAAGAFLDLVSSPEGQQVLAEAGFGSGRQ